MGDSSRSLHLWQYTVYTSRYVYAVGPAPLQTGKKQEISEYKGTYTQHSEISENLIGFFVDFPIEERCCWRVAFRISGGIFFGGLKLVPGYFTIVVLLHGKERSNLRIWNDWHTFDLQFITW